MSWIESLSERAPLPERPAALERGPVLLLAPHPDDDLIGPGCTAHLHAAQGDPVHVVVLYDGAHGNANSDLDAAAFVSQREREARAGGAHLGLTDYEFWRYPEGHEPGPDELRAAARRLADRVRELSPATVYAPWVGEHQIDHHVTARAARLALALAGFRGRAWGYEVWSPLVATRVVDTSALFEKKAAGLAEHRSQLAHTDIVHMVRGLNAYRSLYLPRGATYGEAFTPLGPPSEPDRALFPELAGGAAGSPE